MTNKICIKIGQTRRPGKFWGFLGKFFKNLGRFFSGQYFIFSGQKTVKMIISGHSFTIGQHWFFKSVYLATNILYLMLEH